MSGKMGWSRHGGFVIAGVVVGMVLLQSWWMEVSRGEVRSGLQRATAVAAETQRGNPLPSLDVSDYDRLLHTYVTDHGWVDYAGLARERGELNRFLEESGKISPDEFRNKEDRLAFWINAYNAFTVADVLDMVYGKHQSVRDVSGFFDGRRHLVAGEQLTLDEIEKRGRDLHDPRIHFALVCASTSCPTLQRFAYTRDKLNSQLDQAAREFLADPNRGLRYDAQKNELYVSPIFKWYAGDFTRTWTGAGSVWASVRATVSGGDLLNFIARYAPPEVARQIQEHLPVVHYLDYDWSLNALDTHSPGTKP